MQTVPPEGVKPLSNAQIDNVPLGSLPNPAHKLPTTYSYNSWNQLTNSLTPDAGESKFFYNGKGQLRLSQNAQQFKDKKYSYTIYDAQSRVIEVGEMTNTSATSTLVADMQASSSWPKGAANTTLADITRTTYDVPFGSVGLGGFIQTNLRSRVSYVEVFDAGAVDTVGTYYSYDPHGNVSSLLQKLPGSFRKRVDYRYDLVSGKVNYVFFNYNPAFTETFVHKYQYDSDNRLTRVETSYDGFVFDTDARYNYYMHGPLARVELGHYKVQGLDYYYTLQGWLKGVNMPYASDPGNDGPNSGARVGRDEFGFALGYFQGDYKPVTTTVPLVDSRDKIWDRYKTYYGLTTEQGLYNGNIAWMVTDIRKAGGAVRENGVQGMIYKYDQLNRIVQSRGLRFVKPGATAEFEARAAGTTPSMHDELFTYDANGNITTLKRYNENGSIQDDFTYSYYGNSNRLRFIRPLNDTTITSGNITDAINAKFFPSVTIKGNPTFAFCQKFG